MRFVRFTKRPQKTGGSKPPVFFQPLEKDDHVSMIGKAESEFLKGLKIK
jgi:hypothetical protein